MAAAISMRDLQKMSARAIRALERPVPVKSGGATVGVLVPMSHVPGDYLEQLVEEIGRDRRADTPAGRNALTALARDRGIDWE